MNEDTKEYVTFGNNPNVRLTAQILVTGTILFLVFCVISLGILYIDSKSREVTPPASVVTSTTHQQESTTTTTSLAVTSSTVAATTSTLSQEYVESLERIKQMQEAYDNLSIKVIQLQESANKSFREQNKATSSWEWLYPKGQIWLHSLRCYLNESVEVQGRYAGRLWQNPMRDIECDNLCYYLINNPRISEYHSDTTYTTYEAYETNDSSPKRELIKINLSGYYQDECLNNDGTEKRVKLQ